MNKHSLIFGAAAAFLLLASAARSASLINGGFEDGALDPWFQNREYLAPPNQSDWMVTTADSNEGGSSAVSIGNFEIVQFLGGELGEIVLEAGFWIRHPDPIADEVAVALFFLDEFEISGGFEEQEIIDDIIVDPPPIYGEDLIIDPEYLLSDDAGEIYQWDTVSTDWEYFDLVPLIEDQPGRTVVGLGIFGNDMGTTYIDGVRLETEAFVIPEPAAATLFALAGFAWMLRRRQR